MKQNSTIDLFIASLYNETDTFDNLILEMAQEDDLALKALFDEINASYRSLPKATFLPHNKTINSILQYSKLSLATA